MNLPEGYLADRLRRQFSKLIKTDEFGLLQLLSAGIKGRVTFDHELRKTDELSLAELLQADGEALFKELVDKFALQSPISGVQPKILANVKDKASLHVSQYIIKAWGPEFPELALNEFICMSGLKAAGLPVANMYLSDDRRLFISERFDLLPSVMGHEDLTVLTARYPEEKYSGSYEQAIKTLKVFINTQYHQKLSQQMYQFLVLNTIFGNGDAHLKNLAIVYENINNVTLSPFYDVVSTTAYINNDLPALLLNGSKRWYQKVQLERFAKQHLSLNQKQLNCLNHKVAHGCSEALNLITSYYDEVGIEGKEMLLHIQNRIHTWLNTQ
jgi:serine/threonine-protein kinase HipA